MAIPFPICEHKNVQDFTECCLDCGYNIWTGEEDYARDQREKARREGKAKMREEYERRNAPPPPGRFKGLDL